MDEKLLQGLDADPEAKVKGRSALNREAVAVYLRAREDARIAEQYRVAYGKAPQTEEEIGWLEEVAAWPED